MPNYITIAVKPHVAQFLRGVADLGPIHDRLHIANSKGYLTQDPAISMRCIPEDLEKVHIFADHRNLFGYVAQSSIGSVAKIMSDFFQDTLRSYVASEINLRITKEQAVKQFRDIYGITESLYSTGNIRRQLLRGNVLGIQGIKSPAINHFISRKLTHSESMQVYRLVRKGFSYRTIAKHYNIHYSSVGKICKKVLHRVSYKSTNNQHQSAA